MGSTTTITQPSRVQVSIGRGVYKLSKGLDYYITKIMDIYPSREKRDVKASFLLGKGNLYVMFKSSTGLTYVILRRMEWLSTPPPSVTSRAYEPVDKGENAFSTLKRMFRRHKSTSVTVSTSMRNGKSRLVLTVGRLVEEAVESGRLGLELKSIASIVEGIIEFDYKEQPDPQLITVYNTPSINLQCQYKDTVITSRRVREEVDFDSIFGNFIPLSNSVVSLEGVSRSRLDEQMNLFMEVSTSEITVYKYSKTEEPVAVFKIEGKLDPLPEVRTLLDALDRGKRIIAVFPGFVNIGYAIFLVRRSCCRFLKGGKYFFSIVLLTRRED